MTDLIPLVDSLPPELAATWQQAHDYASQAKAGATRKAYAADWKHFTTWCSANDLAALPAEPVTVALYLAAHAETLKPATLARRLTTISEAHRTAGHESPAEHAHVRLVLAGIRRAKGTAQQGKAPLLTAKLRLMVEALPDTRLGRRDRALLIVGFAGAFRRAELVALDVADISFTDDGLVVTLRRSKTDQEGRATTIGLPYGSNPLTCPVRTLQAWLNHARIETGPLFRPLNRHGHVGKTRLSDRAVARAIKGAAEAVGLDPAALSGHSLRSGFATQAALNGVSDRAIMKQTRHRTRAMVDRYVRDGSLFQQNAAASLGL